MNCLCNGKAYIKHSIITVTHLVLFIEAELSYWPFKEVVQGGSQEADFFMWGTLLNFRINKSVDCQLITDLFGLNLILLTTKKFDDTI